MSIFENTVSKVFKLPNLGIVGDAIESSLKKPESVRLDNSHAEKYQAEIRQLQNGDEDMVLDFFKNSNTNFGPFAFAVRDLIVNTEKIKWYLSPWDFTIEEQRIKYPEIHHLFFACVYDEVMVGAVICAVKLNEGSIEVGGFARDGHKGRGFGRSSLELIFYKLRSFPEYQKYITKIVSETQHNNFAAQKMLESLGFLISKKDQDGLLYQMEF